MSGVECTVRQKRTLNFSGARGATRFAVIERDLAPGGICANETWELAAPAQDDQPPFERVGRVLNTEPGLNGDDGKASLVDPGRHSMARMK